MSDLKVMADELARDAGALTGRLREFAAARHASKAGRVAMEGTDVRVRGAFQGLTAAAKDASMATRRYR